MSKLRSDSILASLTEEQRDQLYDWLLNHSYLETQKLAAKTVAEGGFDLKIHRTTLTRFFEAEQSERQARELAELAAAANNGDLPRQIEELIEATRQKFIRATYELGKIAATDPESYDRVENALHHIDLITARRKELELKKRELDQADKRIEEQRRQWEYNAARAAINHMPELQKIYHDETLDNEDKIWAARDVCFGKPPVDTGSPLPSRDEESEVRGSESAPSAPIGDSTVRPGVGLAQPSSEVGPAVPAGRPAPSAVQPSFNPQPCANGLTRCDTLKHDKSTFTPDSSASTIGL